MGEWFFGSLNERLLGSADRASGSIAQMNCVFHQLLVSLAPLNAHDLRDLLAPCANSRASYVQMFPLAEYRTPRTS